MGSNPIGDAIKITSLFFGIFLKAFQLIRIVLVE